MVRLTDSVLGKAIGAVLAAAMVFSPMAAFAQTSEVKNTTHIPLSGTTADGQAFSAVMRLQRFERVHGQLLAVGVLESGTLNGQSVAGQAVAIPVKVKGDKGHDDAEEHGGFGALHERGTAVPAVLESAQQLQVVPAQLTCTVLHLTLGPLDLNLLGLLVHLNQVVLTIDAAAGGGLLGDLLCGVANLLEGVALLGTLNNILGALNTLGL
jgi:hypothetical protein